MVVSFRALFLLGIPAVGARLNTIARPRMVLRTTVIVSMTETGETQNCGRDEGLSIEKRALQMPHALGGPRETLHYSG